MSAGGIDASAPAPMRSGKKELEASAWQQMLMLTVLCGSSPRRRCPRATTILATRESEEGVWKADQQRDPSRHSVRLQLVAQQPPLPLQSRAPTFQPVVPP